MVETVKPAKAEAESQLARLEANLVQLREIFRNHQNYIKDHFRISELEMEIVQFVAIHGQKKMKEIGEAFNVKLSTLTSIVDKIERQKYVKRVNSKEDRRAVFLDLTPRGMALYEKYSHYIRVMSMLIMRKMPADKFDLFVDGLEMITKQFLREPS